MNATLYRIEMHGKEGWGRPMGVPGRYEMLAEAIIEMRAVAPWGVGGNDVRVVVAHGGSRKLYLYGDGRWEYV